MAKRTDSNQSLIIEALRRMGASVADTSRVGHSFPDLCIGYRGHTVLMEVKSGNNRLTPGQEEFRKNWKGHTFVVRCPEDAIAALEWMEEE